MTRRIAILLLLAGLLSVGLTSADAQAPYGPYETDPVIAGGTDGTVWVSEIVGDQIWFGGTFGNVRNHALVEEPDVPSVNLGVVDINTGLIREDRTFNVNGPVFAIKLVGDRVWIGGDFTQVNGETRLRLAVFDAFSGELMSTAPTANDQVHDLAYHDGGWMYVGGRFTDLGGNSMNQVGRFDWRTGAVDGSWVLPARSDHVEAIATNGEIIYVGHKQEEARVYEIANPNGGASALEGTRTWDVTFSPDGTHIYLADVDNAAKAFAVSDFDFNGSVDSAWESPEANGDAQAIAATDDGLWFGYHEGFQGNSSLKLSKIDPDDGSLDNSWYVEVDSYWGVYSLLALKQGLVATGFFENVNGFEARRLAIFRPNGDWTPSLPLRPDGDVSCDAQSDIVDAMVIVQYLVGSRTAVTECPLPNPADTIRANRADVNIDGDVSIVDALLIAQCAAGIANELCF